MSLRLKRFWAVCATFIAVSGMNAFAQPVFENQTPVGFSPSDSTTVVNFVTDTDVTVRVDLNNPANSTYPVIGNFQKLERSVPRLTTPGTAAYMSQALAVDGNGIVHRAWVQQRGLVTPGGANSTPVYGVLYSKSVDGGRTFLDTVSVSGSLRYDMITPSIGSATNGAFSTVDIVVDSKGNPRVSYAMDMSADARAGAGVNQISPLGSATVRAYNNVYFNYSNDGGSTWLPANNAVVVNDTATLVHRKTAFPRMAITSTDDIFIVYETSLAAGFTDTRLAKMDADSLQLGSAQQVRVGADGTASSLGGIRLDPVGVASVGPDISVGDDDVLHVVWYENLGNQIEHKTLPADDWLDVSAFGWDQTAAGSTVGSFVDEVTNVGIFDSSPVQGVPSGVMAGDVHLFPTVVVDKARTPDRIYTVWKHSDATAAALFNDENIAYNFYTYDGQPGAPIGAWSSSTSFAFPVGAGAYGANGNPLFQNSSRFQIEHSWGFVDRVGAVIDERKLTSGDLHIVFSGGASAFGSRISTTQGNNIYYSRFNGTEWELPQVVASNNNGISDGVRNASTDQTRNYQWLFEPELALREGDDNLYLSFVGGSSRQVGADYRGTATGMPAVGRGYAAGNAGTIAPLPFFKLIPRVVTFDDVSIPNGANVYELVYNPMNPQNLSGGNVAKNLVQVSVADNSTGQGIGASQPGTSAAPGGFLSGQWRSLSASTLGVTSLTPGTAGAVFKGALSQIEAQNDNGVWEGQNDDSGSNGFSEWGDDADKVGMLLRLNVLGSDSATNLFVVTSSTAAQLQASSNSVSQSLTYAGTPTTQANTHSFVRGITGAASTAATTAPLGSFFQLGANVTIIAANNAPVLSITSPDANTAANGFSNESFDIRYVLFDSDDNFGGNLTSEMYYYADSGLNTVQDIRTFGVQIVDENDVTDGNTAIGTDDFVEGSSSSNEQSYSWDDPGLTLQAANDWAPITKTPDGTYYIYIVADDGSNPPVFSVSAGPVRVRHIPLARSISPVNTDTVDTGEFSNLDKVNPYKIKFDLLDYDDDAQIRFFIGTSSSVASADVSITGTFPEQTLELANTTPIQLSDTLRTDGDIEFDFDVTAQGSTGDSVITQGNYFIYAVVADEDTFALGVSALPLAVRHSPAFEFTAPLTGTINKLNTARQFQYTVEWQRGRSDQDLDGNAFISLYYVGVDPNVLNFSGIDSTALIDSGAVLIQGNLREDDEGANDQFVWDFRNPPGTLPKTFRQPFTTGVYGAGGAHQYQIGETQDTAWVYAVLHDTLGNTRVQAGGAVLLLGSQENPASPVPRVTMRTPPAGDQKIVNGDVVRLEWDAFLIDDGTGTDDAYLRLYAAPKGKYSTLTQLEANNVADNGNTGDVFLINSLTGRDDVATNIQSLRESDERFFLWDTKTTSFSITGTPTELDIFVAASVDPDFGDNTYVNTVLDSIATGIGSQAQNAVLSKSPGALRVEFTDPIFSIEMGPAGLTASSGDTLDFNLLVNSQGSSVDLIAAHLNVPRDYFEIVDQDTTTPGLQPWADSTGAFQTPSTVAQNDTTQGDSANIHVDFVEAVILGEVIGRVAAPYDSSQVAASMQLVVKRFTGGAPLPVELEWETQQPRRAQLYRGTSPAAAPTRNASVVLTPRATLQVRVPLEGRTDYADTLDVHLREVGSTWDITDQSYITANDVSPVISGGGSTGTLEDSVNVVSSASGLFDLTEIPPGIYEVTVKAPGYVTGRSDTLNLFNGVVQSVTPTFASDLLGNKSPATPLNWLRGGDATNDNQVDISDANQIFSVWNQSSTDSAYVRDADVNNDGVINQLDLGFVTKNFGNDGFGAPPVFKRVDRAGDNSTAVADVEGVEDVEAWWAGRVFEVTATVRDMNDVAAFGLTLSYDPDRVKPLGEGQTVVEGNVFAENPRGALFFNRSEPGLIEVGSGRIGDEWSASGDADLVTVRFVALGDDPGLIRIVSGGLVNSAHQGVPLRVNKVEALPQVAQLLPNFPNPFNPSTEIRFAIPTARDVKLRIYNQLGQTIRTLADNRMKAGNYALKWDGTDNQGLTVASGVYFYSLEAGEFSQIRKMTLLK
jgi:hypothetical protein